MFCYTARPYFILDIVQVDSLTLKLVPTSLLKELPFLHVYFSKYILQFSTE